MKRKCIYQTSPSMKSLLLFSNLVLLHASSSSAAVSALTASASSSLSPSSVLSYSLATSAWKIRGGGVSKKSSKSNKKKKKKSKTAKASSTVEQKKQIDAVLKEKDAAEALGDAIRDRAEQVKRETLLVTSPLTAAIDSSVSSVGWALGATDERIKALAASAAHDDDSAGGVEVAPSAVLANYFLKSHGGAHGLQCICSLFSTMAGLGALLLSSKQYPLRITLIKRCMLFAMIKHVSGLIAASFLAAKAIPEIGLRKARLWMEDLVMNPVSQYVFYTACIITWLPPPPLPASSSSSSIGSSVPEMKRWWQAYPMVPLLLVGPVLLRELVSTALVISDVFVLLAYSANDNDDDDGGSNMAKSIIQMSQSVVNAMMSVLVTPKVWRSADAAERQAILAKLTSRVSLAMEVLVGLLLTADAVWAVVEFTLAQIHKRPPAFDLIKRMLCTRLYLHFLWNRRKKIQRLATDVRGGASRFPLYVLDVLMDPLPAMGVRPPKGLNDDGDDEENNRNEQASWKEMIKVAIGWE